MTLLKRHWTDQQRPHGKRKSLEIILFVHLCVFEPFCPSFTIWPLHQGDPRPLLSCVPPRSWEAADWLWCKRWRCSLCVWSKTCCKAQEQHKANVSYEHGKVCLTSMSSLRVEGPQFNVIGTWGLLQDQAGKQIPLTTRLSQDLNKNSSRFWYYAQTPHLSVQGSPGLCTIHVAFETGSHFCTSDNGSAKELFPVFPTHYQITTTEWPLLRTAITHALACEFSYTYLVVQDNKREKGEESEQCGHLDCHRMPSASV